MHRSTEDLHIDKLAVFTPPSALSVHSLAFFRMIGKVGSLFTKFRWHDQLVDVAIQDLLFLKAKYAQEFPVDPCYTVIHIKDGDPIRRVLKELFQVSMLHFQLVFHVFAHADVFRNNKSGIIPFKLNALSMDLDLKYFAIAPA